MNTSPPASPVSSAAAHKKPARRHWLLAVDSVFRKADNTAPVSDLYLFGRKQDLAFEQPVGDSPRQRHHIRFWRWDKLVDDRPAWVGSATFDERVGLSYTTAVNTTD